MEEKRTSLTIPLSIKSHVSLELTSQNQISNQETSEKFAEKNSIQKTNSGTKIIQEKNERIDDLLK